MSVERTRDRFDSATISIVVTSIIVLGLLNWPYQYVAKAHRYIQSPSLSEYSFQTFMFPNYEVMQGGFPFTYISRQEDDLPSQPRVWSATLLAANILIATLTTFLLAYITRRHRQRWERFLKYSASSRRRSLAYRAIATGSAVAVTITAVSIVMIKDAADRKLAARLATRGAVHCYALVPRPLSRIFPAFVLDRFARPRGVMTFDRSEKDISEIIHIPTLTSFACYGRPLTFAEVEVLRVHPQFNHLHLRSVEIEPRILESITKINGLRSLELIQCSGLGRGLPGVEQLDRLVTIDVSNSDIRLSALPSGGWPRNLKHLHLSRPRRGCDSLRLRSIPSLVVLNIRRTDDSFNPDVVDVVLADMPRLEFIGIESLQKFSMRIDSAARLHSIGSSDPDIGLRVRSNQLVPTSMWFESLRLRDLPSLRHLALDGLDLEELSLQKLPNLSHLVIGRYGYSGGMTLRPFDEAAKSRLQAIIRALGDCEGPANIDLSSLPLADIDLRPLEKNHRIRTLRLRDCDIQSSQLPSLSRLVGLSKLDLRGCPISDKEACGLLGAGLPLKELLVSSNQFECIEVLKQPKLQAFMSTDSRRAKKVHISECPQLESELVLGDSVEQLRIRNGHSLLGLSVDGPLPVGTELHGLRSLRFFAVGGARANDDLCCHLWQCTDLDHLTVAYGQLSEAALRKIGRLSKLTILALPGSTVDDEIVLRYWSGLRLLSDVDLSETEITGRSMQALIQRENLQKLVVNHCKLAAKDLRELVNIGQLIELEVAGIGLEADTLMGCLRRGMLDRLNLSYSILDDAQLQILSGPAANSLVFLGLRGCGLEDADLRPVMDAHPRLAFDITSNPISKALVAELRQQNRLIDHQDRDGFLRHLSDGGYTQVADMRGEYDPVRGRIHHDRFVNSKKSHRSL